MTEYFSIADLLPGIDLPPKTYPPITRVQLVRYAGASGDFNPLHTDDTAARQAGFSGVISHGMLVMGLMGQAIAGWFPLKAVKQFGVRFKDIALPGDVITVKATVEKHSENVVVCQVVAEDQNGCVKAAGWFEVFVSNAIK